VVGHCPNRVDFDPASAELVVELPPEDLAKLRQRPGACRLVDALRPVEQRLDLRCHRHGIAWAVVCGNRDGQPALGVEIDRRWIGELPDEVTVAIARNAMKHRSPPPLSTSLPA
jgi:hypothetical protein